MDDRQSQGIAESKTGIWPTRAGSSSCAQSDGVRSRAVVWWHALLCAIAVLNLTLWSLSVLGVAHRQALIHAATDAASYTQLLLSGVYVFACALRCVLPVYDIPRIVLVDSQLSSVIVGRTVATAAELCFATQWALILHRIAVLSHSLFMQAASLAIVPLIITAEVCSWHSVLTTAQRGHIIENSLWGSAAALMVISVLVIGHPPMIRPLYPLMIAWWAGGAAYVVFIFLFDVPMYWSRWQADQSAGHQYLSIAEGAIDACRRRVVSYRWQDWSTEVPWMSLYFTFGVWSSISLVYASVVLGELRN